MRKTVIASLLAALPALAFAQLPEGVQRSSSPSGMQIQTSGTQIQGNSQITASGQNTNAVAVGKDNSSRNAVGAVRESVQIQGNTRINAAGMNTNSAAIGKGNQADNKVGTIGGQ